MAMTRKLGVACVVLLVGLLFVGCADTRRKPYQEIAVEKSGNVVVMPLKMAQPLIYPEFSQEELTQVSQDYAIALRKDIETILATRLNVVPAEKVDGCLKENNLSGQHVDHEDCMNIARKCDGDILVETYLRLAPYYNKGIFTETRRYDVDVELRMIDVWNTETIVVCKWEGTKDRFVKRLMRYLKNTAIHPPNRKVRGIVAR
jgi:hypothetical protein